MSVVSLSGAPCCLIPPLPRRTNYRGRWVDAYARHALSEPAHWIAAQAACCKAGPAWTMTDSLARQRHRSRSSLAAQKQPVQEKTEASGPSNAYLTVRAIGTPLTCIKRQLRDTTIAWCLQASIAAAVVTGVSNRVLYKLALVPMGDYVFVLSQFQVGHVPQMLESPSILVQVHLILLADVWLLPGLLWLPICSVQVRVLYMIRHMQAMFVPSSLCTTLL